MEGAESTIVYTHDEEKDAQETKQLVEKKGGKLHLIPADLQSHKTCKEVVEKAKELMGRINILVLNHGTQMMVEKIADLSEYVILSFRSLLDFYGFGWTNHDAYREQWIDTFNTNIHPFFFLSKYVLPQMKSGDTIITCASINHYIGRPDLLEYISLPLLTITSD